VLVAEDKHLSSVLPGESKGQSGQLAPIEVPVREGLRHSEEFVNPSHSRKLERGGGMGFHLFPDFTDDVNLLRRQSPG
jgi:hypothetical protein